MAPTPLSVANQKLEEDKFQTVAIPFYVLYDSNQNVLATFPGLTRSSSEYLAFLNTRGAAAPASERRGFRYGLANSPFNTLDGAAISTADWKGKVVVLNYWATWCIPCRSEIPEFNKMHQDLASKGVEIVGISMDGDDASGTVKEFLKQNPMQYTVGLGTGEVETALPITIVLDKNGKTVQRFDGFTKPEDIRAAVAKAQSAG